MSTCLFVLSWPDFRRQELAGRPLCPALLASTLRRQLGLRYAEHLAFAWAPAEPEELPAGEILRRWGLRLLSEAPTPDSLLALARAYPEARCVFLAMAPERVGEAAAALQKSGHEVEIWRPGSAAPDGISRPLSEALPLRTAHPVALFAEWKLVRRAMERVGAGAEPGVAAAGLRQSAQLLGAVTTARLYGLPGVAGGWEFSAGASEPAGENLLPPVSVEEALRGDLWRALDDPRTPPTWVLALSGEWLPDLVRSAHERGIRVVLWTEDEERVPRSLLAQVDGSAELPVLLYLKPGTETSELCGVSASIRESVQGGARPAARLDSHADGRASLRAPNGGAHAAGAGTEALPGHAGGARLAPWTRLLYHVESILRRDGLSRIPFRRLAEELATIDEFGPTAANALMWLNRARAEGMILVDTEAHALDPAHRTGLCRPHPEHPVARAAVEVPDRCLRLLHQMLQKMPWVSFKLLRSVLLREQWLGGPPYRLEENGVDEWLNFLIHDGALGMTKEPNLVNPEYPVTALRLNPEHPVARGVAAEDGDSHRLAAERAILVVDHFMTRNRKPWMSISALRRALDTMSREELQEVLQGLQSLGALITESYPNPQKEHPTTGCRLDLEQPMVTETLRVRNAIIRVTQHYQRLRSWVPLTRVSELLDTELGPSPSPGHRLGWFLLLRDEGILELDHEDPLPENAWESVRCRLNVSDAVVRAVVAQYAEAREMEPEPVGSRG